MDIYGNFDKSLAIHNADALIKPLQPLNKEEVESFAQTLQSASGGSLGDCPNPVNIKHIDCNGMLKNSKKQEKALGDVINMNIENIMNAQTPNYKRKLPHKDENGNYIVDNTPGKLVRSDRTLDFAISGHGQGFQLEDGTYTRDGRLKFNKDGRLVTENTEAIVSVEYAGGSPEDWSLKVLKVNAKGQIYDKINGEYLGKFKTNLGKFARVAQQYTEKSNVDTPMEILALNNNMRLLEAQKGVMGSEIGLDREAVSIARNVV